MNVRLVTTAIGLGFLGAVASCNHAPVKNLEKSFTLMVQKESGTGEPIKIDFLWVVDNSTSMCQEQSSLAANFKTFADKLDAFFQIDPRLAVTSFDVQCENSEATGVLAARGRFNSVRAGGFPPGCFESRVRLCTSDTDCANMDCVVRGECRVDEPGCTCDGPQGEWSCSGHTGSEGVANQCDVNPNGSINTYCVRACSSAEDCQVLFEDETFECSSLVKTGCLRPAPVEQCPETFAPIIDRDTLDLFPCAATLGVNQQHCFKVEQGLNAAIMAVDPSGPNPEQARAFLRDDAYLVVVFISDEDDCSIADGRTIDYETSRETCALLPTTDQGGPLVPVGHFVNRLKALKQDPGKVIVAAIAGDSTATDAAAVAAQRVAYVESKSNPRDCYSKTTICDSDNGKADFGARYLELTESFGPNGVFTNICEDSGIGPALDAIADTIITVLNQICLPRLILDPEGLVVTRKRGDVEEILTPGDGPGHYRIIPPSEACAVDGELLPAIAFGDPPSPGEDITITYQGDPQFD